ncbi:MAG TPA: M14 family metallopeptidase [Burkholderiaceae bacterium]|nr:M14 family metallopeptidase [Burkholderiaceae bacterium]
MPAELQMTHSSVDCFAQTYAQARQLFLRSAADAGLKVRSHPHPRRGRDDEELAMDVALMGAPDARALLVLSSACHGVEGFCGSGAQVALLHDDAFRAAAQRTGVAVLFIHALNPYGFSWWRRTTHENVDLNRNFHDFGKPLPANKAYQEIAHWVVPERWPPPADAAEAMQRYVAQHGEKGYQAVVSSGQHSHPDGIFFGGREPTWSNLTLRSVLREHARRCARLGWIDFHTGLGPSGVGERIFACRNDPAAYGRARRWWGDGVTSIYDGSSTSPLLTGLMWLAVYDECPQAEYTGIALEYGTLPVLDVTNALRADQWLQNHPEAGAEPRQAIKRLVRDAFYTDTDAWKQAVVDQARDATLQGFDGLANG